jgi:hypothetical protein
MSGATWARQFAATGIATANASAEAAYLRDAVAALNAPADVCRILIIELYFYTERSDR